jgi:hypothetical protein
MYQARFDTNAVVRLSDNMVIGPENLTEWAEYQAWLAEGNTPLPPAPIPVPVPPSVPMWTVRTVLQNDNLFDQAQAIITASTDNALKNVWEYGNFAERNSSAIISLGTQLGLTSEQIDQMFRDANNLTV